jgi:N-acetylmuramoyl-L-alanine amidase
METTTIICPTILADALISLGIATTPEAPKQPEPVKPLWQQFIAAVKASDMTDAMKVACVAQAINESGRGTSRVARECNNFWGIKMRSELDGLAVGRRVEVTSEAEGWAVFAQFPDVATGIKGWLKFLTRSYYKGWEAYEDDAAGFIRHIGKSWTPKKTYADEVIRGFGEAEILLGIKLEKTDKEPTKYKPVFGLNAGHAGTSGASGKNKSIQEHVENAAQRDFVGAELRKAGFEVVNIDQTQFKGDLLATGKDFGKVDVGVSFHQNAADGVEHGSEVLVGSNATSQSIALAGNLALEMSRALGIKNRGVKDKSVAIIAGARQAGCPCFVLTECQFIDDETDPAVAREKTLKAAKAIADTLIAYARSM